MTKQVDVLADGAAHNFIMSLTKPGGTVFPNQIHEALRKEPVRVTMKLLARAQGVEDGWCFEFESEEDYTYFKLRWSR